MASCMNEVPERRAKVDTGVYQAGDIMQRLRQGAINRVHFILRFLPASGQVPVTN